MVVASGSRDRRRARQVLRGVAGADLVQLRRDARRHGRRQSGNFASEGDAENVLDLERVRRNAPVVAVQRDPAERAIKQGASDISSSPTRRVTALPRRRRAQGGDVAAAAARRRSSRGSRSWRRSTSGRRGCRRTAPINIADRGASRSTSGGQLLPTVYGEKIVMRILDKSALAGRHDQARLRGTDELAKFKTSDQHPRSAWCW